MTDEHAPHLRPVPVEGEPVEDAGTGLTAPTQRAGSGRFISDVIVDLGFASRERVDAAVEEGRGSGRRPEQVLLESGALGADQLARATAERFGLDHVDLAIYKPDLGATNMISSRAARRYNAVPIGFDDDDGERLLVAMGDPSNVLALDDLKLLTGHELRPVVASSDDIATLISRMNRLDDAVAEAVEEEDEAQDEPAVVTDIRESAEDAPVIKLVNSIIAQAVEEGASDIHFEPEGRDMRVRFRIDGVLSESASIPRRMVAGVISRMKIMGDLDIAERRLPQDGRLTLHVEGHAVDIRIVTVPSVLGEGLSMRLLDKEQVLLSMDELGMGDDDQARFRNAYTLSHGAVLVTGPTGSGKSTSLYAALNMINSVDKNVITIEDPVEYQLPGINQLQVHLKAGLTFAAGLRSMLRADPDVIMVGEIRDAETARISVEAALTGHLVLTTLHTNDAPSALPRLSEMGIEPFLTASAVECVIAQRLARVLCTNCKRRTLLSVDALRAARFEADFDIEAHEPVGCPRCKNTGYKGRIGLYEVMQMSDEIRSLTIERGSSDAIREKAIADGMRMLRDDGLAKVRQGITSIAEVARVT